MNLLCINCVSLKLICLGANLLSNCNINLLILWDRSKLFVRDVNYSFYQRKNKISENVFNTALLVDLCLLKHRFPGENTVNIVSIGCCFSQELSSIGLNSVGLLMKPSSTEWCLRHILLVHCFSVFNFPMNWAVNWNRV